MALGEAFGTAADVADCPKAHAAFRPENIFPFLETTTMDDFPTLDLKNLVGYFFKFGRLTFYFLLVAF